MTFRQTQSWSPIHVQQYRSWHPMGLADRKLGQFLLSFLYVSGNQSKAKIEDECDQYSLWTLSVYNRKTKQVCELILFKIWSYSDYRYIYMDKKNPKLYMTIIIVTWWLIQFNFHIWYLSVNKTTLPLLHCRWRVV